MEFSQFLSFLSRLLMLLLLENGIYVACTAGGGGHSSEILSRLTRQLHSIFSITIPTNTDADRAF